MWLMEMFLLVKPSVKAVLHISLAKTIKDFDKIILRGKDLHDPSKCSFDAFSIAIKYLYCVHTLDRYKVLTLFTNL